MGAEQGLAQAGGDPGQFEPTASAEQQKINEVPVNPTLGGLAQLLQAWYTRLSDHYRGQGMDLEANVFAGVADDFGHRGQRYNRLADSAPAPGDGESGAQPTAR